MKTLLLIFSVLVLSAGAASADQPHHYLFFVHGIGGNAQTFGAMPEALVHHLDQAKPEIKHEAFRFVYPTSDQTMDGDAFAVQFGQFIHSNLKDRLRAEDKISLISHSQGGLVSLIWYFHAYAQSRQYPTGSLPLGENERDKIDYHSEYIPFMDAIVSIGTPYWGSKLASILINDSWMTELIEKKFFQKLGRRQLEEMALGSKTIISFRRNVTQIPTDLLNEMKQKIRPLNIAGAADLVNLFRKKSLGASVFLKNFKSMAFGGRYYESDIAVPIPSARFDSIYTVDRNEIYLPGAVTDVALTKKTDFSPLVILNTIHASPFPKDIPDMVEAPTACIQSLDCAHPTIKYIFDHMVGNPLPSYGPGVASELLGGFMTSFRVNFPQGVSAKNQSIQIQLVSPKSTNDFEVKIGDAKEIMSKFDYFSPTQPNVFLRSESGHVSYKNYKTVSYRLARQEGVIATFLIQAKGFRPRYVETILKPTYSTFVEVSLAPE